jgi:two-component system, sensor histidine kinase and response regulator
MILDDNNIPKVLIVDDEPENLLILVDMLEDMGVELFVASNGEEALRIVEIQDFDLIVLDIIMPGIDGYTVCETIKKNPKTKDIPTVFISVLYSIEDKIKAFDCGADDYISKPFIQQELVARVQLHLNKSIIFKSIKQLLRKSYHELYNPLAVINTSLEMQNLKYGPTRYMDSIAVASKTLQLVYDDLYYSLNTKKKKENLVFIDLVQFVKDRVKFFAFLAKTKNITVDFSGDVGNFVQMRTVDLLRVIDNTLSNAIKYAKMGTTISIEIINNEESMLFICKNSGSIIKDTKKIFDSGYREDSTQIGMGIGLEIVASICHYYKIHTEVISKDAVTTFRYEIPKNFKGEA